MPPGPHAPATPSPVRRRLGAARQRLRRAVLGRRRLLAALCAGLAVVAGVRAVAAPVPPGVDVVVAARALPTGTVLAASDLTTATLPPDTVPDDVLTDPVGSVLAGPVARGEPVTAVRVVGQDLASDGLVGTGRVAVPVRLPDAGAVDLLAIGDRIDVVATDPQAGSSDTVAAGVPVLALPGTASDAGGGAGPLGQPGGRLVVLAVEETDVHNLATAGAATFLTYVWSR